MKLHTDLTAALVWAQYGPYHFARFRAARTSAKKWRYLALEIASRTTTYAWDRKGGDEALHTLCSGEAVENVGFWKVFFRAFRFFRRHGVNVVFVPSYWPSSSLGVLLAAKCVGAGLVMMNESHRHTAQATGFRLRIKRALVRLFDAALVGGRPQREYFTDMGLPVEAIFDGYDVVDNGFFLQEVAKCRAQAELIRANYQLPDAYFLNIGRMEEKKNLPVLLEAYARCRASAPGLPRLVLVGSGSGEKPLQKQCQELGLSFADLSGLPAAKLPGPAAADVYFYGFRQAEELAVFYAFARVFILPSKREEWGLVVNEALACGLPVLVSSVAGCAPDLVSEGVNGFTFDPADVSALTERLNWFGRHPVAAGEMGARSLELSRAWDPARFGENAERAADFAHGRHHSAAVLA